MTQRVSTKTVYVTADGKLVDEGDPNAAFLVAREGAVVDEAHAERLGVNLAQLQADEDATYDAKADHARKHGGETPAQAEAARQRTFEGNQARGGEDPDGPPDEGERSGVRGKSVKTPPGDK